MDEAIDLARQSSDAGQLEYILRSCAAGYLMAGYDQHAQALGEEALALMHALDTTTVDDISFSGCAAHQASMGL